MDISKPIEGGSVKVTKKKLEKGDPKAVDAKVLVAKLEGAERVIRIHTHTDVHIDMKHMAAKCNLEWSPLDFRRKLNWPERQVKSELQKLIEALKKDHEDQVEHGESNRRNFGEANRYKYLTDALIKIDYAHLTPEERIPDPYACMEYELAALSLKHWGFKLSNKDDPIDKSIEEEYHPLTDAYVEAYMKAFYCIE